MIFDTLTKGEDGLRTVKVRNDNKRKVFVQLNGVKISDITDDILIDIVSDVNVEKIKVIDSGNVTAAQENAVDWFGKELSEDVIRGAYTHSAPDSHLNFLNFGLPKNHSHAHGISFRSGFTQSQSLTHTQTNMHLSMTTNKKNLLLIYKDDR